MFIALTICFFVFCTIMAISLWAIARTLFGFAKFLVYFILGLITIFLVFGGLGCILLFILMI